MQLMLLIDHTFFSLSLNCSCQHINSSDLRMLQRQFSLHDMPVSSENIMLWGQNFPNKILSLQHASQNSTGLNSCVEKQGQNDLSFQ